LQVLVEFFQVVRVRLCALLVIIGIIRVLGYR
jgi:hypothetical protein